MKKNIRGLVGISSLIFVILLIQLIAQNPPANLAIDFEELADFGTAVGGIFTFLSVYLLYKTLTYQIKTSKEQSRAFNANQFEARVFELLRYHRDNVAITELRDPNDYGSKFHKGHKAFREIYRQFSELLKYVTSYMKALEIIEIYNTKQALLDEVEILRSHHIADKFLKKVNEINIAYLILFYGLDIEGRKALEDKLSHKYDIKKLTQLLDNLAKRRALWSIKEDIVTNELDDWESLDGFKPFKGKKIKFYGGHQSRLGHYFRHLYQTISYIDNNGMSYEENYEYAKIIRAQLSTHEQKLLFINSISDVGRGWELKVYKHNNPKLTMSLSNYFKVKCLITKYDLIRSTPNNLDYINISDIYPNMVFQGVDKTIERLEMDDSFKCGYY